MAIIIKLNKLLEKKGISLEELSKIVGIPTEKLSILKNETALAVQLTTTDAICKAFKCQPGELLEYQDPEY